MWMNNRFEFTAEKREFITKIVIIIIVAAIGILTVDVFTRSKDGRRQIIDDDGATETSLTAILSDIKGAGDVDIMIRYGDGSSVTGVIVTASGAGNVIVKNNLTQAVAAVFDIPTSNVMVFEKENGGLTDEKK